MFPLSSLRSLLLVGASIACASAAQAALVYSDSFGGSGNLNGSAPEVRPGSEVWTSRITAPAPAVAGGVLTVATGTTSFLPLTISVDTIYTLTATIDFSGSTTAASIFAGIGFFNSSASTDTNYSNTSPNTPWAFVRAGNTTPGLIGDTTFRPNGGQTSDINTNFTVTDPLTLQFVLNTNDSNSGTAGRQATLQYFVNDIQRGSTHIYNDTDTTALLTNITRVGITANTSTDVSVTYDNFSLDVVPEPSSALLLLGSTALLAFRRPARCRG